MINEKYIRFDWAAKRMLRDKANFDVLEGLMTVLIGEKVTIDEILESEGNQENETDKYNRVDVMARNSKGEFIIVEVQLSRERYYLERILYGVSKVITDNMHLGDRYEKVKKVYSINIIYFPMGKGKDYLYHGITTFTGVHTNDKLEITDYEADTLRMRTPQQVFPEYFIIRVNEFNQVATTPLEEWIEYLKNGKINSDTKAPGLQEARQKLLYMNMSDKEKRIYEHHLADQMIENDILDTARIEGLALGREEGRAEGREEGRAEGREEGRAEGREEGRVEGRAEGLAEGLAEGREKGLAEGLLQVAKSMKQMGLPIETITQATGLPTEEIRKL